MQVDHLPAVIRVVLVEFRLVECCSFGSAERVFGLLFTVLVSLFVEHGDLVRQPNMSA